MFSVRPGITLVGKGTKWTTVTFMSDNMLHLSVLPLNNDSRVINSRCIDDDNYNKPLSQVYGK